MLTPKFEKSYKQKNPLTSELGLEVSAPDYERTYSKNVIADNIPTILLDLDKDTLEDSIPQLIVRGFINSTSEFHRLVEQREIQINNEKIEEDEMGAVLYTNDVIKIGRKFIKIVK